jgi:hypothetical protein
MDKVEYKGVIAALRCWIAAGAVRNWFAWKRTMHAQRFAWKRTFADERSQVWGGFENGASRDTHAARYTKPLD